MKRMTPERQQILDILSDGCPHSPADIATRLKKQPNNVTHLLLKLMDAGLVRQSAYGMYAIPSDRLTPQAQTQTAPQANPDMGVYVLRNGSHYKIGKSRNVQWRVTQLRTALPQETLHIHTILTDRPDEVERDLHQRFASKRVRGEWFDLDMFDVDEICDMGPEHD